MAYVDCMAENLIKSGENCMVTDQLANAEGSSSDSVLFWKKLIHCLTTTKLQCCRGQKFYSSACNYERNLQRTSNSSQSTHPVGQVLWEELL